MQQSRSADQTLLEVTITEGRNRIIRRLMEHVGHPVVTLKRIAHGPLRLSALKSGQTQKLSEKEYWALRCKVLGC